eukprot:1161593-Pelagomonas_calceolata.AAC.15
MQLHFNPHSANALLLGGQPSPFYSNRWEDPEVAGMILYYRGNRSEGPWLYSDGPPSAMMIVDFVAHSCLFHNLYMNHIQ